MTSYKCRGCGALNSIVEIDLVPRVHHIYPDDAGGFDYGYQDEAYWEASTTIGYGCINDTCPHRQGGMGEFRGQNDDGETTFGPAGALNEIADVIDDTD
mgnify:CR=1 FL=1